MPPPQYEPHTSVEELFKTLIATGGIMLALLWGLTQKDLSSQAVTTMRLASIVLVLSSAASLIGLQFVLTELEKNTAAVSKAPAVAWAFLVAWVSFLLGSLGVVVAIFEID